MGKLSHAPKVSTRHCLTQPQWLPAVTIIVAPIHVVIGAGKQTNFLLVCSRYDYQGVDIQRT